MLVDGLAPDQAEAVLLRVLGAFDVTEVARIMGRSRARLRPVPPGAQAPGGQDDTGGAGGMTSDDRWTDPTTFDEELDRLLSGAPHARGACVVQRRGGAGAHGPGAGAGRRAGGRGRHRRPHAGAPRAARRPGRVRGPHRCAHGTGGDDESAPSDGDGARSGRDGARSDEARRTGAYVAAASPGGDVDLRVRDEPVAERLRTRMAVSELDEYRAKHGERYYIAKHCGTAGGVTLPHRPHCGSGRGHEGGGGDHRSGDQRGAAAAATTGIVATVVVPRSRTTAGRAPSGSPWADTDDDSGVERPEPIGQRAQRRRDNSATCSNILMTTARRAWSCPPADPGATTLRPVPRRPPRCPPPRRRPTPPPRPPRRRRRRPPPPSPIPRPPPPPPSPTRRSSTPAAERPPELFPGCV